MELERTIRVQNNCINGKDEKKRTYIAIDLKSFYASVECKERDLDPLTTNLVVADVSRTEKTICLAVTPSLKAYGIPGRARLFEVIAKLKEVNAKRKENAPNKKFVGESFSSTELSAHPEYSIGYIAAVPRMALYMDYSKRIYQIYLKYIAAEDIHVYSIDEVFMDVTEYLEFFHMTAKQLAETMIQEVLRATGITATAGIGTNLYLCKVAMDIWAKHIPADEKGVRIAELDEVTYRRNLWAHTPLTDFWRVGRGYEKRLHEVGIHTMGDIARCSLGKSEDFYNEDLLFDLFGVNAELLIDHAWGYEPCTIEDIRNYRPESTSLSSGQVLTRPYSFDEARIVIREMTEALVLDLVEKGLVTNQMVLTVGYDIVNTKGKAFQGEVSQDRYGRIIPKHAHGTVNLDFYCSSTEMIVEGVLKLYDRIVSPDLYVRRMNVVANHTISENDQSSQMEFRQLELFSDFGENAEKKQKMKEMLEKEKRTQKAVLDIKQKYGKNAILKGTDFMEGATARERNAQIGGHKA